MIGNNLSLFLAHDAVFLLFPDKNDLHRLKEIFLAHNLSAMLHCIDGSLIDHIGKIRADRTGSCKRDCFQIHALVHAHVFCMYFQNLHTAFQIRFVHDNPPVETARTQKRRIQDLRTVRCRQDQEAFVCIKSVHLRKELIERLFSLIISAERRITGLSDGVDLIDKHNTRSLLLGLFEQVADTGSSDTNIHLYKR